MGGRVPLIDTVLPVLGLPMVCQEPRRQAHVAPGAADPLVEPLQVGVPLPRNPEAVGLRRLAPIMWQG